MLATYCGQTKNDIKIKRIKEIMKYVIKYQPKDDDIETLNENSPWVIIFVNSTEVAKLLLDTRAIMTVNRGDLISFRPITSK